MLIIIIILQVLQLTVLVSIAGWLAGTHRLIKNEQENKKIGGIKEIIQKLKKVGLN